MFMCFSAEASFGLSTVLLPAGGYCLRSALGKNRSMLGLAIVPFIFSFQQFCEGFVWRGIYNDDAALSRPAAFVFLYIALAFWPFWIPLCAFFTTRVVWRKSLLACCTLLGLVGGLMLFLPLVLAPEVLVLKVWEHSIFYDITQMVVFEYMPIILWQISYVLIVGVPFLIVPARGFLFLGIALIVSAGMCHAFFQFTFPSVWCFFAAVLSLYLCFVFWQMPAPENMASGHAAWSDAKL